MKKYIIILILSFAGLSSCKKHTVDSKNTNIYTVELVSGVQDYMDPLNANCFISLNGYVYDAFSLYEKSNNADPSRVDLCYDAQYLYSPSGNAAKNNFVYFPSGYEDIGNWPVHVSTLLGGTSLTEKDFENIKDVNVLKSYADSATKSKINISSGYCYTFKNDRYEGIIYVVSADNVGTHLKFCYTKPD